MSSTHASSSPVDFDLELGPVISCIFPPYQLYPSEAENMSVVLLPFSRLYVLKSQYTSAFSAFPDSPQFREGSQMHSFRIREQMPPRGSRMSLSERRPASPDGFIYGYSHFNQRRDAASKRGYVQVRSYHMPPYLV